MERHSFGNGVSITKKQTKTETLKALDKRATFWRQEIAQVINTACKENPQEQKTLVFRLIGVYGDKTPEKIRKSNDLLMQTHIRNWINGLADDRDGKIISARFRNDRKLLKDGISYRGT